MTFLCGFIIFATLLLQPGAAVADTASGYTHDQPGAVTAVEDSLSLRLDDGRVLRLIGLHVPESIWRKRATEWLERNATGKLVTPFAPKADPRGKIDRYGRLLRQVRILKDGPWLQQALLEHGLARVQVLADNAAIIPDLYAFEAEARLAGRGIWADPRFQIRDARSIHEHLYSDEIVEDTILQAKEVRGRVYLNFGRDWKTDFTVTIDRGDLRKFTAAGLDPASWSGRRIRVRGWVKSYNGPMIEATHPAQIAFPADDPVQAATSYNPG